MRRTGRRVPAQIPALPLSPAIASAYLFPDEAAGPAGPLQGRSIMMWILKSSLIALCLLVVGGPVSAAWDPAAEQRARQAIEAFVAADPGLDTFFDEAHGYAVFPEITKGGFGIGGAHGGGTVFEQGRAIGFSTLTQATIGFQLGGQTYREIVFFRDRAALDRFKRGNFELAAGASAVAVTRGASRTAAYGQGVAVFTMTTGGLMFEASIGGQRFTFEPKP